MGKSPIKVKNELCESVGMFKFAVNIKIRETLGTYSGIKCFLKF